MRRFQMTISYVSTLLLISLAVRADDLKVLQLEQDVRDLKQQVMQLDRRIESLESTLRNVRVTNGKLSSTGKSTNQSAWLTLSNWEHVQVGMTEFEVLQTLGPPTSLRKSDDGSQQTLLYALEIGVGNFLTGSITLQSARVIEVNKPSLR